MSLIANNMKKKEPEFKPEESDERAAKFNEELVELCKKYNKVLAIVINERQ